MTPVRRPVECKGHSKKTKLGAYRVIVTSYFRYFLHIPPLSGSIPCRGHQFLEIFLPNHVLHRMSSPLVVISIAETDGRIEGFGGGIVLVYQESHER